VALKNSVWAPVALKLIGLALGMLALSGVGVASILSGANGVQVPLANLLGSDIHAAWLANKSAASGQASSGAETALAATNAAPHAAPAVATDANAGPTAPARDGQRAASAGMTEDGKVILNLASVEDLRHLPGVGPKRADAILALRTRLGRFKQVSDLLRVKGIGVRGLKKIMPHVVLDAPKPAA
jgi:competence protein ComEA